MKILLVFYHRARMEAAKAPAYSGWWLGLVADGLMAIAARWALGSLHRLGELEESGVNR